MMPWMDTGSTDGTVIDSGRPEKLEKEGTRGPVGSRELGKVVCSTGNLGGKIDPSGPVPPKPGVSGLLAVGLNRNPVTVASLGRNFSKLVTAGTVGTLSVTGRALGWGWNLEACCCLIAGWLPGTNWNWG